MFKILSDGNRGTGRGLFASMHRLRHKIFIEERSWPLGEISSLCGMERDDFDIPSARYIVRVNGKGDVDACMRLLPTSGPYLLGMKFGDLIQKIAKPNSPRIWEMSRFCADRNAPANVPGQLMAAMLEFGLANGVTNYVSVSDVRMEPALRRCGSVFSRMGEPRECRGDVIAGVIFKVSEAILQDVRRKSGISGPLLAFGSEARSLQEPLNRQGTSADLIAESRGFHQRSILEDRSLPPSREL
jgi:acyl homoserine lactone synthase